MGDAGATDDPVRHEEALQNALAAARTSFQATSSTREAVFACGEQLKTEAENFSAQFLLPLNDPIDVFNRELLNTRWIVQYNAEHTVSATRSAA